MSTTRDKVKHKINQIKESQWLQNNKKLVGALAALSSLLATVVIVNNTDNSFNILVDGQIVGTMQTQEEVVYAVEQVIKEREEGSEGDLSLNQIITIQPTRSSQEERVSQEELIDTMTTQLTYEQKAFKLIIDSKVEVIVSTHEQAETILKNIVKQELPEGAEVELQFTTLEAVGMSNSNQLQELVQADEIVIADGGVKEGIATQRVNILSVTIDGEKYELEDIGNSTRQLQDVDFHQEVVIEQLYIDPVEIAPQEEAFNILTGNTDEIVYYELEEGDNLWDVAIENNTTMDAILDINPDIVDVTRMQIGDVVKIAAPEPVLSVAKEQRVTFKELIPADIEYVEFSDLYEDQTKVYQEGHDGVKSITVLLHTVNGKEISRELLEEEILKEEKTKVIAFGTQKRPEPEPQTKTTNSSSSAQQGASVSATSGMFMNPLNGRGTFTSGYGSRWGTFHKGIDIAAPSGTPIYASASGTVTYSGYNNGGYGNMVVIDHGNGYETYYAHNVANYVNVGDYVNKGENIAGVGSTGYSTGNHIHFEIRYNGSPINPYSYVY